MQARRRYSKLALWVNIKTAVVEENLGLYEIFFSNKGFFSMGEIAFLPKRALAHLLDAFMTVWKAKEDIGFTNREKKSAFHWFWTFQMSSFLSITSSHLVLYPMMSLRSRKWRNVGKRNTPVSGIGALFVIQSGLCGAPFVISDSLKFHTKSEARLTMVVAIR